MNQLPKHARISPLYLAFLGSLLVAMGGANQSFARIFQGKGQDQPTEQQLKFFESKVRPILVEHCYACHSGESGLSEGGLRVDSKVSIRAGGGSGPAVVPGDLKASLLIQAIRYEKEDFAMPPEDSGGKMSKEEIAILEEWVRQGAADPRVEATSTPIADRYAEAKQWWAFQTLQSPHIPTDTDKGWSYNDIDRFIGAGYRMHQLKPARDASPETLLRRVCFDLIGLPPTPEELAAFEKMIASGQSPSTALGKVVDSLLSSEQFGMHWGRHWLDVARYAESTGREVNLTYSNAWRYRDYVIDAFNQNMPYDQFLKEQIAGDLLPAQGSSDKIRQTIATGFLAIGSKSVSERNPKQFAVDLADEQIDTVFQATMGLTVACARCHDHKFDPIPQRDYTAIAGIFLSTETKFGTVGGIQARNSTPLAELPAGLKVARPKLTAAEIDRMQESLKNLRQEQAELVAERRKEARNGTPNPNPNLLRIATQIAVLEGELASYEEGGAPKSLAMAVADKPKAVGRMVGRESRRNRGPGLDSIGDSPLFVRGDISTAGSKVPRGLLTLFESSAKVRIPSSVSGRKELAEWIVSKDNSMTARVAVNRIWYWLFGQGLVTSLDNFGSTGSEASHPELLDYLARKYIESGWDTKALIREIVSSHVYQLSAEYDEGNFKIDPDNQYVWRANRQRLSAESIRDAILAASGRLDGTPKLASEIGKAGDTVIGGPRQRSMSEEAIVNAKAEYRSVYLPVARGVVPEILETFDLPDASTVQTSREATNVPSQSLFMLNNRFVEQQSREMSMRILKAIPGKSAIDQLDARLELAYQLAFARRPDDVEKKSAKQLLQKQNSDAKGAWTSLARGLFASAEFRYVE